MLNLLFLTTPFNYSFKHNPQVLIFKCKFTNVTFPIFLGERTIQATLCCYINWQTQVWEVVYVICPGQYLVVKSELQPWAIFSHEHHRVACGTAGSKAPPQFLGWLPYPRSKRRAFWELLIQVFNSPGTIAARPCGRESWKLLRRTQLELCNFANAFAQRDCLRLKADFESFMGCWFNSNHSISCGGINLEGK